MIVNKLAIDGLCVFSPIKYPDNRGYFRESFHQQKFSDYLGSDVRFVQDNESFSRRGVLRGLHFQVPPFAQGKLVRVLSGSVLDVALDLRVQSPTYGKWHAEFLSAENGTVFWIPEGFAHGFIALEENTLFLYKCTNYYHPLSERTIRWDDPTLNIDWQQKPQLVSDKDKEGVLFNSFASPF